MSKPVVIFGVGEYAAVARVYLAEDSPHEVVAFTAHEEFVPSGDFEGLPVVPFERLEEACPPDEFAMFVAIGFSGVNQARAKVYADCKARGYELISYVCSKATHWGDLSLGENTFIFEDNTIQPFARIGSNVVMWSGNHIGHHVVVGNHCFITSHVVVSGGVSIGDYSFIGVNATIRDHIAIAPSTVIGAGALVMRDTEPEDVLIAKRTERSGRRSSDLGL
jgi:sugar O-acyltransferase (sialic acid O-acetyltransferase NeuD family)